VEPLEQVGGVGEELILEGRYTMEQEGTEVPEEPTAARVAEDVTIVVPG